MKAVFISYNQAYNEELSDLLKSYGQKGFTRWQEIQGRGTVSGDPHYGDHAWPTMNDAILTVVDDDKVEGILADIRAKDEQTPKLGLRAFVWNIESIY